MPGDLDQLIPHRPPMQWITALTGCTETTATATAKFSSDHFATADGVVLEPALVECIAQTVAAAMGERARESGSSGTPAAGMLTGVSNFKIQRVVPADATIQIHVCELKRIGMMQMVSGTVSHEGNVIASGELTFYA